MQSAEINHVHSCVLCICSVCQSALSKGKSLSCWDNVVFLIWPNVTLAGHLGCSGRSRYPPIPLFHSHFCPNHTIESLEPKSLASWSKYPFVCPYALLVGPTAIIFAPVVGPRGPQVVAPSACQFHVSFLSQQHAKGALKWPKYLSGWPKYPFSCPKLPFWLAQVPLWLVQMPLWLAQNAPTCPSVCSKSFPLPCFILHVCYAGEVQVPLW